MLYAGFYLVGFSAPNTHVVQGSTILILLYVLKSLLEQLEAYSD